ncbi:hypothetical protein [Akkermansia sp. BCRC 18949]|uniref:hypothetical protein n=1 Tax=Akkermansia sp. BCRC 18949 TaxID=3037987 RepID=UPI00384D9CA1
MTTKEFVEWIKTTYREKTLKESTIVRWIRKNFLPEISIVVKRIENPMINKSSNEDKKTADVNAQKFIAWVQARYQLANKTSAVKKASQILRVSETIVWKWLSGKTESPASTVLLMEMIMRHGLPDE